MPTLTIRNLPPATVKALKARAKANNRSVEAEVRTILESAATRQRDIADFIAEANRIAAMTPNVPQSDSTRLIREDRER